MRHGATRFLRRGILTAETSTALVLMMLIAALAASAMFEYRGTDASYLARRAALWAADAQLKRFQAGAPLDSQPPAELLADGTVLSRRVEPGRGPWEGLTRVTVTARVTLPSGRTVQETLAGYIRQGVQP